MIDPVDLAAMTPVLNVMRSMGGLFFDISVLVFLLDELPATRIELAIDHLHHLGIVARSAGSLVRYRLQPGTTVTLPVVASYLDLNSELRLLMDRTAWIDHGPVMVEGVPAALDDDDDIIPDLVENFED